MIAEIEKEYRDRLLAGLAALPEGWQGIFKRMYAERRRGQNELELLEIPMEQVVAKMPVDRLDWALKQVRNSEAKLQKQNAESGVQ